MKSSVTISLVEEARGGPFVYWGDWRTACDEAAKLGFDGVEIFPPAANCLSPDELSAHLQSLGLRLAAVGTGAGWVRHQLTLTASDEAIRQRAIRFVESIIDFAGPLGAPTIIGSMQGRWGDNVDQSTGYSELRRALNHLGRYAARHGVPLLYEPLNRYETNFCRTLSEGVALLKSLDTDQIRLLADLFHMNIEETDLAAAMVHAADFVGHVHFVDSNRRAVGMGHLDLPPIVAGLRNIGYQGYLSAEALPLPTSAEAATETIRSFRRLTASPIGR